MKFFSIIAILLFPLSVFAGFYGYSPVDTYDPQSGLYYKGFEERVESKSIVGKGPMTVLRNVNIFDPSKNSGKLLFPIEGQQDIAVFLFETEIKDGIVEFYNGSRNIIKNNSGIKDRKIRDKILIGLRDTSSGSVTLYTANKFGENLKEVAFVSKTANFHIDVANSKLRVVRQVPDAIEVQSFDW